MTLLVILLVLRIFLQPLFEMLDSIFPTDVNEIIVMLQAKISPVLLTLVLYPRSLDLNCRPAGRQSGCPFR